MRKGHGGEMNLNVRLTRPPCWRRRIDRCYTPAAAAAHPAFGAPARAIVARKPVLNELSVELLDVGIDSPVLPVDLKPHEIGFGAGDLPAAHVGVEHLAHERGILRTVDEIERLVAHQTLVFESVVNLNIERFLL